jgi:stearoyl-CoA desaturase (delta-9 desaturase)
MNLSYTDWVTVKVVLFTIVACFGIPYYFMDGGTLLSFMLIRIVSIFFAGCYSIASHRWLVHNSFEPSTIGKWLMLLGFITTPIGKPIHLIIAHRTHHKFADEVGDPHSPRYKSFWQLWLGRYDTIYSAEVMTKDFFKQKEAVFLTRHYWTIFWVFNLTLALIDLKTALVFTPFNFVYAWTMSTVVNYHAHYDGKTVAPRNLNPILTFLTFGEGLHKNHHDHPRSYSFAHPSYDRFDIGAWFTDKFLKQK